VATISLGTPPGEDEDIDITKPSMLVAIGRGLKSPDNVAVARALADALGPLLSGTFQVCDLGWLPRDDRRRRRVAQGVDRPPPAGLSRRLPL
jgi:electron transfer flavoprotein alpha subunit